MEISTPSVLLCSRVLDFHDLTGRWYQRQQKGVKGELKSLCMVEQVSSWMVCHGLTGEGVSGYPVSEHETYHRKYAFLSRLSISRRRGNLSSMNALLLWGSSERSSQGLFKKVSSGTTDPHDFILTVSALSQNHSCHFWPPVLSWKQNPLPPAVHYSISEQHALPSADISIYLWLDVQ